jgi:hypothetical protein
MAALILPDGETNMTGSFFELHANKEKVKRVNIVFLID